jgi:hypothetical protein
MIDLSTGASRTKLIEAFAWLEVPEIYCPCNSRRQSPFCIESKLFHPFPASIAPNGIQDMRVFVCACVCSQASQMEMKMAMDLPINLAILVFIFTASEELTWQYLIGICFVTPGAL